MKFRVLISLLGLFFTWIGASATMLYVIGSNVNGNVWSSEDASTKMTAKGGGVYEWSGTVLGSSFKIYDGDWITGEYNIGGNGTDLVLGVPYYYGSETDSNIYIADCLTISNPHIVLDLNKGTLLVEGSPDSGSEDADYYLCGTFNNWDFSAANAKMEKVGNRYVVRNLELSGSNVEGEFKVAQFGWSNSWGTLGDTYITDSGPSGILISEREGGSGNVWYELEGIYDVYWTPSTQEILFEKSSSDIWDFGDLYMVGTNVNGKEWTLADPSSKFTYVGDGQYDWYGSYLGNGFKINDGTWDGMIKHGLPMNIGSNGDAVSLGGEYPITCGVDGNIGFSDFSEVINPHVHLDFKTMKLTLNTHTFEIVLNLPAEVAGGKYRNCVVELLDLENGSRHRNIVTDRPGYIFRGLNPQSRYQVSLYSPAGFLLAREEVAGNGTENQEISFDEILKLVDIRTEARTPEGEAVVGDISFEWYLVEADGSRSLVSRETSANGLVEGQHLLLHASLGEKLAMLYELPADLEFEVSASEPLITLQLAKLRECELRGVVKDMASGAPVKNASVSLQQIVNGQYAIARAVKTDASGNWTVGALPGENTSLTISADGYINSTVEVGKIAPDQDGIYLGSQSLRAIDGIKIVYDLNFKDANQTAASSDYRNTTVEVFDLTRNVALKDVAVQYPHIILMDEGLTDGSRLRLTLKSLSDAFKDVDVEYTIGEKTGAGMLTFDIIGKGGISASFDMTENAGVTASLYSGEGKLLSTVLYEMAEASFTQLNEGKYTLVSMGRSDFSTPPLLLESFDEIGLKEGRDYVKNEVEVMDGVSAIVHNKVVPLFDEGIFYYTSSATSVYFNKTSVTSGNYLTLRAQLGFKDMYAGKISDVRLIVDMPDNCQFVDNSVIQNSRILGYDMDNHRLTVNIGDEWNQPVMMCMVPVEGGSMTVGVTVAFSYGGKEIRQPIGTTMAEVKDVEIVVPPTLHESRFTASGIAMGNSEIEIFDDGTLLASTKANAVGSWSVECNLADPYNLSDHSVYAVVHTPDGNTIRSAAKTIRYDVNAIRVSKLTLYHWNPELGETITRTYDFQHPSSSPAQWALYYPEKKFTYTLEFTENDPDRVKNVILYLHTADGEIEPYSMAFDDNRKLWYVAVDMGSEPDGHYPVNYSVNFDYISEVMADRDHHESLQEDIVEARDEANALYAESKAVEIENSKLEEQSDELSRHVESLSQLTDEPIAEADLKKLYSLMGWEYDPAAYRVDMPEEIDDAFVADLMQSIEALLGAPKVDDEEEIREMEAILAEAREVERRIDENPDIDYSIVDGSSSSVALSTAPDGYTYTETDLSNIDRSNWDESLIQTVKMDDGSELTFYSGEEMVIVDEAKGKAWLLTLNDPAASESSRMLRAPRGFWDTVFDILERLESIPTAVGIMIDTWTDIVQNDAKIIEDNLARVTDKYESALASSAATEMKVQDLEKNLKKLKALKASGKTIKYNGKIVALDEEIKKLSAERKTLLRNADTYGKSVSRYKAQANSFQIKAAAGVAMLRTITSYTSIITSVRQLIIRVQNCISESRTWDSVIANMLPCDEEENEARQLIKAAENYKSSVGLRFGGVFTLSAGSLGLTLYSTFSPPARLMMNILQSLITSLIDNTATHLYESTLRYSREKQLEIMDDRSELRCRKNCGERGMPACPPPPPTPGGGGGGSIPSGSPDDNVQNDPSGYVYDVDPANRLEGVKASIYSKTIKEDMYGNPVEEVALWNAEEYSQKNPLYTNARGYYRWDVPQGLWQVKFEKDGYATAYSDWLPVPPPQLDVNMAMERVNPPAVTEAHAYASGVEIFFDSYMSLESMDDPVVRVYADGEKVEGQLVAMEFASDADALALQPQDKIQTYASRVRFVPDTPFAITTSEVELAIGHAASSSNGIQMEYDFNQILDLEKKVESLVASDVEILYGEEETITLFAIPADAAAGRSVRVTSSSDMIVELAENEFTFDEEGRVNVPVIAGLPGNAMLNFTLTDANVAGSCGVKVVTSLVEVTAPQASRPSGSKVYRGSTVKLSTTTENGVIYFTTDGSCPCDPAGTRRKYTVPIVIDRDMKILAMTVYGSDEPEASDIVEFEYSLLTGDMNISLEKGWNWISHSFADPVAIQQLDAVEEIEYVASSKDYSSRVNGVLSGTLASISATEMVKVNAESDGVLECRSALLYNPAEEIAVNSGKNWIGYPLTQVMTLAEAFALADVDYGDAIVGQEGFSIFDGSQWVGSLTLMRPGNGYLYYASTDKGLNYNTTIVSKAQSMFGWRTSLREKSSSDVTDIHIYPEVMAVVADVSKALNEGDDQNKLSVAAYNGNICRGVAPIEDGRSMINVYGTKDDEVEFYLMSSDGSVAQKSSTKLKFEESLIGSLESPMVLDFVDSSEVGSVSEETDRLSVKVMNGYLKLYGLTADRKVSLDIFSPEGMKVMGIERVTDDTISIDNLPKGIYMVVMTDAKSSSHHKVMLR